MILLSKRCDVIGIWIIISLLHLRLKMVLISIWLMLSLLYGVFCWFAI